MEMKLNRDASIIWIILGLFIKFDYVIGSGDHPWCYDDEKCAPSHWGGICKTGHSQSPIDFNTHSGVIPAKHIRKIRMNHDYHDAYSEFYIKNNGHTVQVQLKEDMTSSLLIDCDGFRGGRYEFSQMHFHWGGSDDLGSEHTVDGKSYPLELHLVHFSDKYENILSALTDQNTRSLAVFGIFFHISETDNLALKPIVEALDTVETYHPDATLTKSSPLNISAFYPDSLDLYRYEGSLTTPSCGEKVVWTVFKNSVPISEAQMKAFRKMKDSFGKPLVDNFRPTQPLGRRKVLSAAVYLTDLPAKPTESSKEDVSTNENLRVDSKENDLDKNQTTSQNSSSTHEQSSKKETNNGKKSESSRLFVSQYYLLTLALLISIMIYRPSISN